MTELYKKTCPLIKKINPKLMLLGPNPCGGMPPADVEAMTPYFDLISNQSWYVPSPYARQLATGCDTKALVDLSTCPAWPVPQHALANDPEALREQFSQVFRNGGEGLIILGVEWYDRELEHPKYINPLKWRALLEITDTLLKMKKVKLPKPDTAILYSSDTMLTYPVAKMAEEDHWQMYSAYAALGPGVGSWFSFVSDRQIERGSRNLSDYKAVYVPLANYERGIVLDKLEQYVKNGGAVVCTDPTAFTWDINGDDLSARWEKVSGVKRGAVRKDLSAAKSVDSDFLKDKKVIEFPLATSGCELTPSSKEVKAFAVFADGSLAATVRQYGKGRVILFASDPFASTDYNAPIVELFRNIQLSVGAKTNQDIWRFKLPPFKTVYLEDTEKHVCLTNNNVVMDKGNALPKHNLNTKGTYTCDHFPTGCADFGKAGQEIPFTKGHLTNRRAAYHQRNRVGVRNPVELDKWIVRWMDSSPVNLTFDLKAPYSFDRIKLFYSGALPAVRVKGSRDAQSWEEIGAHSRQPTTQDVIDLTLPLKGTYRYLRVEFGAREAGAAMELAEAEIWGDTVTKELVER